MAKQRENGISWTDETWNPLRGCTRVSEGCRNCYAEGVAARFSGPGQPYEGLAAFVGADRVPRWTGKVALVEHMLDQPLRWKKPRRIFVNSMSDLFHEHVPDEWLDRIFAIMALCPQHTFQVLTKRPEKMRKYLSSPQTAEIIYDRACDMAINGVARVVLVDHRMPPEPEFAPALQRVLLGQWPLPNVWLGVSVEDQATANERIPLLLETPAAKRFISAEPLLGAVNLRAALRPTQPLREQDMPQRWDEFAWPAWVPDEVRKHVVKFWDESWGRGPRSWLRDAITQGGPALWSEATLRCLRVDEQPVSGRFVHLWNNIGAVVHDDGGWTSGSFTGSGMYTAILKAGKGLDWIIVGGESGRNARPMHPDWVRSLRDQCAAAEVPFFFKQWGEWAPEGDDHGVAPDACYDRSGKPVFRSAVVSVAGKIEQREPYSVTSDFMRKCGKKAAGHLLDGREHREFPA